MKKERKKIRNPPVRESARATHVLHSLQKKEVAVSLYEKGMSHKGVEPFEAENIDQGAGDAE